MIAVLFLLTRTLIHQTAVIKILGPGIRTNLWERDSDEIGGSKCYWYCRCEGIHFVCILKQKDIMSPSWINTRLKIQLSFRFGASCLKYDTKACNLGIICFLYINKNTYLTDHCIHRCVFWRKLCTKMDTFSLWNFVGADV